MAALSLPPDYPRIRQVGSFDELISTPFGDGVNALCWPRTLPGDFGEVVRHLSLDDDLTTLDEEMLLALPLGEGGKPAIAILIEDLRRLRDCELDPVLNAITAYPRDEPPGAIPVDVYSFHADSAPVAAETWLCTYHGAPSEGLRNDEAVRRIDLPGMREILLADVWRRGRRRALPAISLSSATTSTTLPFASQSPSASESATSGASPSITPAVPFRPASTGHRRPVREIR